MSAWRALLIAWTGAALCAGPALSRGAQPAPATVRDLAWGEVLFEHYQDHRMEALVRLSVAEARGELAHHGGEARLLEAGLYLAWGLRDEAAAIFEQLLASNAPPAQRDQAWYWLARIHYERAEPARALAALRRMGDALPATMAADRNDLEGRILLALGDYEAAASFLAATRQPGAWQSFADFNRAVALARSGREAEAAALLDRLGRGRAGTAELELLRDRANLALGLARLDAGDARGARAAFDRVRLDSPLAPRALLAAGWADAGQARYREALGPWGRLASRPDLDGAALEALLALPWAWYQLDEAGESVQGYRRAAEACESELARLGAARRLAHGEALWRIALEDEPLEGDAHLGIFLHALAADHPFRAVASDLRDLRVLRENLLEWQHSLGAMRDMVEARRARFEAVAPRVAGRLAEDDLEALGQRVDWAVRQVEGQRAAGVPEDLADAAERRLLARLAALRARIEALPPGAERDDLETRRRRLEGALHWQLNYAWPERMYAAERAARGVQSEFTLAQDRRARVAALLEAGPSGFEGYDARIEAAAARVAVLLARVEHDQGTRLGELRALVLAELDERELRVAAYLGQARFALAAAYDQATQPRAALPAGPAGPPEGSP
jgi:hypothetical protein